MNSDKITLYKTLRDKMSAFRLALTTMSFDQETIAPIDGNAYRNEMMAILGNEYFKLSIDPNYIQLLFDLKDMDLDPILAKEIEKEITSYEKSKNIPLDFQKDFSLACMESIQAWKKAKDEKNFSLYEPHLKKVIEMTRQSIQYRQKDQSTYDQLLGDFQEGLTFDKVKEFFDVIEARLVPFIQKISALNLKEPEFLHRPVPIDKQKEVTEMLRHTLGFDPSFSYIGESEHPFSTTLSINDTRTTTKYLEDQFTSNIFSIIHEIGHGTYNHQVNPQMDKSDLATTMSMTMHESQSRFLENNIARTKAFWIPLYDRLQKIVGVLDDISLDDFIYGINFTQRSLVRTEADELTYPLHILIRTRLEAKIFNDNITDNLDQLWKEEYQNILGLSSDDPSLSILQDIHWSQGAFGYFPTYALGSAYAAQFYEAMSKDLDIEKELAQGNYYKIKAWNKEKIHHYGAFYTADEMILKATGKAFDPNIYCDYLINKYTKLLKL